MNNWEDEAQNKLTIKLSDTCLNLYANMTMQRMNVLEMAAALFKIGLQISAPLFVKSFNIVSKIIDSSLVDNGNPAFDA